MLPVVKISSFLLLVGLLFHTSCKKELSCENCKGNKPPVANAGADQIIVLPKDSALLDGSASTDPDGTITSYKWKKIAGPVSANIIHADSSKTLVKTLVMGVYSFELSVTDNGGLSAKDTVQIIVNDPAVNQPPIANAGSDQIVTLPADSALLNGSSSFDPDGTIVSYQWRKISGGASTIVNPQGVQTMVKNLVVGVYQFELTVNDNGGLSAKDTMQIQVLSPGANHPPVACAGSDQIITLPTNTVNVDGSCSTDPDNNIAYYLWTKISGPPSFNITNANAVQTQVTNLVQGVYEFELKVTDAGGLFSKDTMKITVNAGVIYLCGDTNRTHINAQLIPMGTLSQTRSDLTVASAGNKILFAGGVANYASSSRVDIYDIGTQTWSIAELCVGRYLIGAATAGNKIFFGGGELYDGTWPVDSVDIYDVSNNTWKVSHLSRAGHSIVAAAMGNKVLFAGGNEGFTGGWPRGSTVDIYNMETNSWSTATLSGVRRGGHAVVTLNNKIYFAGGETWPGAFVPGTWYASSTIDIYDNATNSWTNSSMVEGKLHLAGIAAGNNIYLAGGETGSYSGGLHKSCLVEIKNVTTGNSSIQYLSGPAYPQAVLKDNKIIFYSDSKFDLYDITTNSWSVGLLPINLTDASIISVNNIIYLAAGSVNGVLSNKVWKLDF